MPGESVVGPSKEGMGGFPAGRSELFSTRLSSPASHSPLALSHVEVVDAVRSWGRPVKVALLRPILKSPFRAAEAGRCSR